MHGVLCFRQHLKNTVFQIELFLIPCEHGVSILRCSVFEKDCDCPHSVSRLQSKLKGRLPALHCTHLYLSTISNGLKQAFDENRFH